MEKGQNEVKEIMEEIKEVQQETGANQHDETIVKLIVEAICKKHATKEARLLEIERMQIESDKEFKKVAQQIEREKMEKEHSREITGMILDSVKWVTGVASLTTIVIFNKKQNIAKINQGL